jgi:hypothetical protein
MRQRKKAGHVIDTQLMISRTSELQAEMGMDLHDARQQAMREQIPPPIVEIVAEPESPSETAPRRVEEPAKSTKTPSSTDRKKRAPLR